MAARTSDGSDGSARDGGAVAESHPPATDTLGYEQARAELADIVRRLEAGGLSLEESLALWERGEQLADRCQHWLDGARERLEAALHADRPPSERN